ncbi:MAG: hypothetical protein HY700_08685 [Gemmatimonadetes bacterium]|nr:hypothetical protein [Gemmatimonadota bacterium]
MKPRLGAVIVACLVAAGCGESLAPPSGQYEIVLLTLPPGMTRGEALGISPSGLIAGWTAAAASSGTGEDLPCFCGERATIWVDGVPTVLPPLVEGGASLARDINDAGVVVGLSVAATRCGQPSVPCGYYVPTRWVNGIPRSLLATDSGHNGVATAINGPGVIVGRFGGPDTAFSWEGGVLTPLPTGGQNGEALDINDRGDIVGSVGFNRVAARWRNGNLDTLEAPLAAFGSSRAETVNAAGDVGGSLWGPEGLTIARWGPGGFERIGDPDTQLALLGLVLVAGDGTLITTVQRGRPHAVVWRAAGREDLGVPPGYAVSGAMGINERGDVVGVSVFSDARPHDARPPQPVLWRRR